MIDKLKKLLKNENIGQIIRFGFVGVLNTIVGYGTYYIGIKCGLHYILASTISQIIGTAHSYIWNKKFTFKSEKKSFSELVRFVSVYVVQYVVNVSITGLFINFAGLSAELAGFISMVICTAISFLGHKFWSFKK